LGQNQFHQKDGVCEKESSVCPNDGNVLYGVYDRKCRFWRRKKGGQSAIPLAVGKCAIENQSLSGKLGSGTFSWYLDILEVIPGKTPEDAPKAKARFII
jgi:hypothetical protein